MITSSAQEYKYCPPCSANCTGTTKTLVVDLTVNDAYRHTNRLINDGHSYIRTRHISLVARARQHGYVICIAANNQEPTH